jgi:hypothetical protein
MSMPVDDESAAAAASVGVNVPVPMVCCNAMAWTDETEGRLRVLVTCSDSVAGTVAVMEKQAVQCACFTGTAAEKRVLERKWCKELWQAMLLVEKRKSIAAARAVERAVKRQCKTDERQTEALLAKARDWSAHVFDPTSAESVSARRRWSRSA